MINIMGICRLRKYCTKEVVARFEQPPFCMWCPFLSRTDGKQYYCRYRFYEKGMSGEDMEEFQKVLDNDGVWDKCLLKVSEKTVIDCEKGKNGELCTARHECKVCGVVAVMAGYKYCHWCGNKIEWVKGE